MVPGSFMSAAANKGGKGPSKGRGFPRSAKAFATMMSARAKKSGQGHVAGVLRRQLTKHNPKKKKSARRKAIAKMDTLQYGK